jgi:hypothetical protein
MTINKDEWGNISLPGLSDEKLLNTNWNKVAAAKENWIDPKKKTNLLAGRKKLAKNSKWKENNANFNQERAKTDEYKVLRKDIMEQKYSDPEYKKWHEDQVRSKLADPEILKQRTEAHTHALSTPEYKENFAKAMENRSKSEWLANVKAARSKPIVVKPYGVYSSATEAGDQLISNGVPNAHKKIQKWLKTDVENCYYITREEYIMLTRKDIV